MNDNICQLRLDFEQIELSGPSQETSLCEEDALSVIGTAAGNPKVICGSNSGQHSEYNITFIIATTIIIVAVPIIDFHQMYSENSKMKGNIGELK